MVNLGAFIRFHASRTPNWLAILYDGQRITYEALYRRVPAVAAVLVDAEFAAEVANAPDAILFDAAAQSDGRRLGGDPAAAGSPETPPELPAAAAKCRLPYSLIKVVPRADRHHARRPIGTASPLSVRVRSRK